MADRIRDYEPFTPFTTVDSGSARWCFAVRGSRQYFLKEFLSPCYPLPSADISESRRASLTRFCEGFEARKRRLYQGLRDAANGNIVVVEDFFREGSKYYCASERIDTSASHAPEQISRLAPDKKRLILLILAHSMARLGRAGIVHADLKPSNVLLKPTVEDFFSLKLIDFDAGFFEDEAASIEAEEFTGDPVYLAPEMFRAMRGDGVLPTQKVDVFAAGLMFHQFLCGRMPDFDHTRCAYPYEAVLDGRPLAPDSALEEPFRGLIESMLRLDPKERPDFQEIFQAIQGKAPSESPIPPKEPTPPEPPESPDPPINSRNNHLHTLWNF